MKINKLILQQRQQRWNSNKHNKLMEMWVYHIRGMETRLLKNTKSHLFLTSYWSYKNNTFLLKAKQQQMCHACQTKYTLKHNHIECTDLAHIRETFYSPKYMKELFQNIEVKNAMSFLTAINTYGKI